MVIKADKHISSKKKGYFRCEIKDGLQLLFDEYYDTFFDNKHITWRSQKHPYLGYKQLFRLFLFDIYGWNMNDVASVERRLASVNTHRTTLYNVKAKDVEHILPKEEIIKAMNMCYAYQKEFDF